MDASDHYEHSIGLGRKRLWLAAALSHRVIFAIGHVYWAGETWLTSPTVAKAWLTGLVTLAFPYFIIQPCLGFGIAASKKPKPWLARTLSLFTHSAYGVGLFSSALLLSWSASIVAAIIRRKQHLIVRQRTVWHPYTKQGWFDYWKR